VRKPVAPPMRPEPAPPAASEEVARVKFLYLERIRARILDGSYLSPRRVETALDRLLRSVGEEGGDGRNQRN